MTFKDIMELAYYFSCVGLFVVAILGLKQLSIAKADIRIRSIRESAHIAAEQCKAFSREILPLVDDFDKLLRDYDIPRYEGKIDQFMQEDLKDNPSWSSEWYEKWRTNILNIHENVAIEIKIINLLESFSIYFTRGIADEAIAFSSIGISFCNIVERYYPYISFTRHRDQQFNYYNNIIKLYRLWKDRVDKYGLIEQKKNIEKQLLNIPNTTIKPTGTV